MDTWICKICGQTFEAKRIALSISSHLSKSHSMTVDEYNKAYPGDNTPVPICISAQDILQGLITYSETGELPDNVKNVLQFFDKPEDRFKVVLNAIAASQVKRLKPLQEALEKVERRLYSDSLIDRASTRDLLEIGGLIMKQQSNSIELLHALTDTKAKPNDGKAPTLTINQQFNIGNNTVQLPADAKKRKVIADKAMSILSKMNSVDIKSEAVKDEESGTANKS